MDLGETLLATTELRREAHPVMQALAAQYRETIHLAILDDTRVVYIDKLAGQNAVRNYTGQVIAALSMSVPTLCFQQSETEFRKVVIRSARMISERMGYYGS